MTRQTLLETGTKTLLTMLTYGRPHASDFEAAFVERYVNSIPGMAYDKFGNGVLQIGSSPVLWSCHTDTVHHKPGKQIIKLTEGIASLAAPALGMCLGADDGAGVWLLREMALADVPGLYVFHCGEERGGLGSSWIRDNRADLLSSVKCAIAFDRKGQTSIITRMMVGRTCSDAFARSLGAKLGPQWRADDTGSFTDTANYVDHIGECTNLSIGYEREHGPTEILDIWWLENLRNEMIRFDPTRLVFEREPGEIDPDDFTMPDYMTTFLRKDDNVIDADFQPCYDEALIDLCRNYPDIAAELLERAGYSAADLIEAIETAGYDL